MRITETLAPRVYTGRCSCRVLFLILAPSGTRHFTSFGPSFQIPQGGAPFLCRVFWEMFWKRLNKQSDGNFVLRKACSECKGHDLFFWRASVSFMMQFNRLQTKWNRAVPSYCSDCIWSFLSQRLWIEKNRAHCNRCWNGTFRPTGVSKNNGTGTRVVANEYLQRKNCSLTSGSGRKWALKPNLILAAIREGGGRVVSMKQNHLFLLHGVQRLTQGRAVTQACKRCQRYTGAHAIHLHSHFRYSNNAANFPANRQFTRWQLSARCSLKFSIVHVVGAPCSYNNGVPDNFIKISLRGHHFHISWKADTDRCYAFRGSDCITLSHDQSPDFCSARHVTPRRVHRGFVCFVDRNEN